MARDAAGGITTALRAACAHQMTGHRAGVLAPLEGWRAGDERRLVAVDTLHETPAAGRKVVDEFRLMEPQAIEVDQVHVGTQARREPAAVPHAEEIGGLAGLTLDQQFERQPGPAPPVAAPMRQHEG